MKRKLLAATAAITLGLSSFTLTAPVKPAYAATTEQKTQMRNFVRSTLGKHNVRGSVVVIKDGEPQQISYGWGWYGKKLGNGNSKVVYPTCSLQKVITAAMIIQLINETNHTNQQFSQYTKISRWYPNLKNADQISVGNLLTHTSGITATDTEIDRGYNYSEDNSINWIVDHINSRGEGQPGTYFYNNTNYILLAGIIAKVTNQSYESNFQNRIVNKLGLQHTYLYQNIPRDKTDAISYTYSNGKNYQDAEYVKRSLASQLPGAANMFSTPMDYYKILVGLSNGQILDRSDFNYLTHLKSKVTEYSGGVYLKNNDTLMSSYGNLAGTHFGNWFQVTTDMKNGLIMFLNQTDNNENNQKDVGYEILNYIKPNTFTQR
nr:serine hydrolase domain-containing protein [Lactobacillus intestinalis]